MGLGYERKGKEKGRGEQLAHEETRLGSYIAFRALFECGEVGMASSKGTTESTLQVGRIDVGWRRGSKGGEDDGVFGLRRRNRDGDVG